MGVFDFTKDAGASVGGGSTSLSSHLNTLLPEMLSKYGLQVDNPKVNFENGTATIWGEAANQVTKEKIVLTLGNLKGVSRVDDQMTIKGQPTQEELDAAAEAQPEPQFYTVKRGDSLSKIAKALLGDAMKYPAIFEANKPMLKDPNLIYPGQVLRIPQD